jgi:hypothetical protein
VVGVKGAQRFGAGGRGAFDDEVDALLCDAPAECSEVVAEALFDVAVAGVVPLVWGGGEADGSELEASGGWVARELDAGVGAAAAAQDEPAAFLPEAGHALAELVADGGEACQHGVAAGRERRGGAVIREPGGGAGSQLGHCGGVRAWRCQLVFDGALHGCGGIGVGLDVGQLPRAVVGGSMAGECRRSSAIP